MSWEGEGESPVDANKVALLAHVLPTFFLGQFFGCSPHSWDHLLPEQVLLDYFILSAFKELEGEAMDKLKREQSIGSSKGRQVRTTSDADFFDRMNVRLKDNG